MGTNAAEGRMVNELPIIGHFLFGVSSTYGSIFRKWHRKPITHWPVLSTAIRLLFVFLVPLVLLDAYGWYVFQPLLYRFYAGVWAGLSVADGIHWWLDKFQKD